jgi:hypothetical protein
LEELEHPESGSYARSSESTRGELTPGTHTRLRLEVGARERIASSRLTTLMHCFIALCLLDSPRNQAPLAGWPITLRRCSLRSVLCRVPSLFAPLEGEPRMNRILVALATILFDAPRSSHWICDLSTRAHRLAN